ncbi:hypothetical protein SDC9_173619 [bioreactor metagenome]|uniref:Uncharacterized protein n=1 Tax=bioreactor metagenome TaxID=1076179 RepID=A0A645GHM9_9ZZZZ
MAAGDVLAHEAEEHLALPKVLGYIVDHAHGALCLSGQDEMADDHALFKDAVFIHLHRPHLRKHFVDGALCHVKIVGRGGIPARGDAKGVLKVGQIHVHMALHELQRFQRIEADFRPKIF